MIINWREVPFVRLLLPFAMGIAWALYGAESIFYLVPFLLLLVLGFLFMHRYSLDYRWRWVSGAWMYCLLLAMGYQLGIATDERREGEHYHRMASDREHLVARVESMPTVGKWIQARAVVTQIVDSQQVVQNSSGQIQLFIEVGTASLNLAYGDQLIFPAKFRRIPAAKNPHAFDYQAFQHWNNLHYQVYLREGEWQVLQRHQGQAIFSKAYQIRSYLLKRLSHYLPHARERMVAQALILGYREGLDADVRQAYSQTGAIHVLAVSGLHVGLVYLGLSLFLGQIKSRQIWWKGLRVFLFLMGIWTYALISGASASVLRAATMFSFLLLGQELQRHTNIYNTLAASAFFLLCFQPFLLANTGFQLSYLAVLGIVYFQPKIYRCWIIDHPWGDRLWQLIALSLAAQLMTFPIGLYYFHQFPIYFWLSGLVVVQAAGLILGGGLLLLLVDFFLPPLASLLAFLLQGLLWLCNALIFAIQQLPFGLIEGVWIGPLILLLLYLSLLAIILAINTSQKGYLWLSLIILGGIALQRIHHSYRQIHHRELVIYNNSGSSLIDCIQGKKAYCIRSGPPNQQRENYAAQAHRSFRGIREVEYLADSLTIKRPQLYAQQGHIQFFDQRLVLLDQPISTATSQKLKVDFVLIQHKQQPDLKALLQTYQVPFVVLDLSIPPYREKQWKKLLDAQQLAYWSIRDQGAFQIQLNPQ
ncbi:MAG: ComEC/Rec2 family competence protein [Bacteroidota bacterium]